MPAMKSRVTYRSRIASALAACLLSVGFAGAALAQAARWQYGHSTVVLKGEQASMQIVPVEGAKQVQIRLSNDHNKRVQVFKVKALKAGQKHVVRWSPLSGTVNWTAEITGTFAEGEDVVTARFETHVLPPLRVDIERKDIYLADGKAVLTANQPLGRATATVIDAEGETVVDEALDLSDQGGPEGGRFTLEWTPPAETVEIKVVRLVVHDPHDAQNYTITLSPFFVELPHEDVVFESGSAEIRPQEAPKLHKALDVLNGYVKKWGSALEARLYIGGYTDTVGGAADNRALSEARAKAIAKWFRDHGVKLPIYSQGFGESGLAVPTEDNVDEARNRRAVYVLGASAPRGGQYTGGRWRRLK